ncbi:MAG: phosphoribosylanthranilate isomerase [Sphingomonadales bacterium]|nr:phosphoribosylanthranilate isomerase [Sphingomonadales bacterium]
MPAPLTKICGLRTAEALDAAIAARADYAGFNFYAPSPRFVSGGEVSALGAQAAGRITRVGVFVDADDALIGGMVATGALDVLQLHGSEPPARAAALRARYGLPVWKVLSVSTRDDIARAHAYAGAANFILFDAKTPKGTLPGGMGLVFDWSLLSGWDRALPWGLAGGLSPANVADAARATGAPLVDTSSGVESAPGVKDADLIAAFCRNARGA